MISNPPVKTPFDTEIGPEAAWLEFMSDVYKAIQGLQSSGTTANRPIKNLFVGRFYFDTSLGARGKPIWIAKDGSSWIDATGALA